MKIFHFSRSIDFMAESLESLEMRSLGSYTFGPPVRCCCALLPAANCLAGVPIGFGGSAATIEQPGDDIGSDAGSYVEIGIALRPVSTFPFGLQLFGEGGGLAHTTYLEYDEDDFGGDEVEQDIDVTGAYLALGAGYRF